MVADVLTAWNCFVSFQSTRVLSFCLVWFSHNLFRFYGSDIGRLDLDFYDKISFTDISS